MARELEAKIAQVLNSKSIAINVGGDDGVEVGNTVIAWRTVQVEDPDSFGKFLGTVTIENLRLKISQVQSKLSVASVQPSGMNLFGTIWGSSKVITSSDLEEDEKKVRLDVGDVVTVTTSNHPSEGEESVDSNSDEK